MPPALRTFTAKPKRMPAEHFTPFRLNTLGHNQSFPTPFGEKRLLYADWIASGRLYGPIEQTLTEKVYPFCGNTHTETSVTGTLMTLSYHEAKALIKRQVNAGPKDALIFSGTGMTDSINKLQRILGLRLPDSAGSFFSDWRTRTSIPEAMRPVVFVTHMEHHSNHTSWLETLADVEIIAPDEQGYPDLNHLADLLKQYLNRPLKIASVTAASNVTGVMTPYHDIAALMHEADGYCFVDFACSGPYVHIDMHPADERQCLDAVFLSPHKFLGGPGTPGIMILNSELCRNAVPDRSGGGTVRFTTPWKTHHYYADIELREDGGTPGFLQGIKAAMCFRLKEEMGVDRIQQREQALLARVFSRMKRMKNLHILAGHIEHRIGSVSFFIEGLHFNLGVRLLNDHFGIQVRGGCACAGTYGHYLLNISREESDRILCQINEGNLFARPGWIRLSVHPTMSDEEMEFILDAIEVLTEQWEQMGQDYEYVPHKNIFRHKTYRSSFETDFVQDLFGLSLQEA